MNFEYRPVSITQTFYELFLLLTWKRTARSEYVSKKSEHIFFLFRISTNINWNCLFKISRRKKTVTFVLSSNSEACTKILMKLSDKCLCTISAIAASTSTVFVHTKCKHFKCVRPFHKHNVGMFLVHKYLRFHKVCSTLSLHITIRKGFERFQGCCFGLYKNYDDKTAYFWRHISLQICRILHYEVLLS
jgi:hypothetical protein